MARVKSQAAKDPKESARRAKAEMYRRLIMEAAEVVFAQTGYAEAKIQDIAQGAGIALGTLYTVFPGKAEIYEAIQELRGREILEHVYRALQGYEGFHDAASRGIDAYARYLIERPHYLRMHLREGLSWADRDSLQTGEQVAAWERGMDLAESLIKAGVARGLLDGDDTPRVLIQMVIAAHQVQLRDWLDRGADSAEVEPLIGRMQRHFLRVFVRDSEDGVRSTPRRARG